MSSFFSKLAMIPDASKDPDQTVYIMKICLHNFDALKPHFYIVKLGFTGVYIIFLISAQKQRLWVLVRTALIIRTASLKPN